MIMRRISKGIYLDDVVNRPDDEIEIVQIYCKDCRYWNSKGYCRYFNLNQGQFNPDLEAYMPMDAYGFCSRAERDIYKERCRDCSCLVESGNGEWLCENCYYEEGIKEIHNITFEECDHDKWGEE